MCVWGERALKLTTLALLGCRRTAEADELMLKWVAADRGLIRGEAVPSFPSASVTVWLWTASLIASSSFEALKRVDL